MGARTVPAAQSADRKALLEAIRSNPKDDTLRGAFADLLREEGDSDWADFINLQLWMEAFAQDKSRRGGNLDEWRGKRKALCRLLENPVADRVVGGIPWSLDFLAYDASLGREARVIAYLKPLRNVQVTLTRGLPSEVTTFPAQLVEYARYLFEWPIERAVLFRTNPYPDVHTWDWWSEAYATAMNREVGGDELPEPLFRLTVELYPDNASVRSDDRFFDFCSFGTRAAAKEALEKTVLEFGRRAFAETKPTRKGRKNT